MEPATKDVFEKLKPVCIPLIKEPTPENISRLDATLKDLNVEALQKLQEYVLFPLRLALKSSFSLSDKECIGVLDCMADVLKKTTVTNWELFQDLFNCLCLLLSVPGQDMHLNQGSEERKIAIVCCLMALLSQPSLCVLTNVYQVEFLPALGHAVSALLTLTQHERYQKLKVSAIECLLMLAQVDKKGDQYLVYRIGDVFASFLPGMTITLSKVITCDVKQGQAVTVHAIKAWASLVTLVIGDASLTWAQNRQTGFKVKNEKQQKVVIERSPDWAKATGDKLDILIGRIVTLTSHANWKVRLAMVNWAEQLLNECQRSLKGSIPKLLEVIVGLTNDDYPNVCKRSEKVLEEYMSHQTKEGVKSLIELLEENLHTLATTLPRLIRTADDDEKLKTVRLHSGYLKILGPNVSDMFNSCSHIRRLGWSLMQVVELSCGDLSIVEVRTANMDSSEGIKGCSMQKILKSRKSFKHFSDGNIFSQICTTCHYLGYYGDLALLVDYFTEQILTSRLYRKEAILILNEIILGCSWDKTCAGVKHSLVDKISSVAEVYVSDVLFNVSTSITASTGTLQPNSMTDLTQMLTCTSISPKGNLSPTLLNINSNIQQVCLLVEGIANFAVVLGESFPPLLMVVLYPLLEKLGDDTLAISQAALFTMQTICDKAGYSCISDVICSNVDYLIHTISLKMRHFSSSMRAPLVLGVMFDHSSKQLLSYVKDTIDEVFLCLDDHHEEDAFLFMRVLAKLISAINRWYGTNPTELMYTSRDTSPTTEPEQKSGQTLREYFLEYDRHAKIARMDAVDIEDTEDFSNEPGDVRDMSNIKKIVPQHVQCVTTTLDRCCHFVASKEPRLRLLVLDIIRDGCGALYNNKDELFPAIHRLWSPLVDRFQDDEPVVIIKAFQTLCIISDLCGDFLNRRATKEILPKVCDYLKKQAATSERIGPTQKFSVGYKSQLAILQRIGKLCKELNIQEEHCEHAVTGCLPYLSARQPLPLQEACLKTFTALILVDPDIVWLRLMDIWCPTVPVPPHYTLNPIKFASTTKTGRTVFSDNIEILLNILQDSLVK